METIMLCIALVATLSTCMYLVSELQDLRAAVETKGQQQIILNSEFIKYSKSQNKINEQCSLRIGATENACYMLLPHFRAGEY